MYKNKIWWFVALFVVMFIVGVIQSQGALMFFGGIGFIISFIAALIRWFGNTYKRMNDLEKQLRDLALSHDRFHISQEFFSNDKEQYIALDEASKRVCIIYNDTPNSTPFLASNKYNFINKIYTYKDILQSTILIDEFTLITTTRTEIIGRNRVGRRSIGEGPPIIGALISEQISVDQIKKMQLQIVVNDMAQSYHRITFGSFPKGTAKNNPNYIDAEKNITHWYNLLAFVIKQSVENDRGSDSDQPLVADELIKLSSLLRDGLITQAEFDRQKGRLLS